MRLFAFFLLLTLLTQVAWADDANQLISGEGNTNDGYSVEKDLKDAGNESAFFPGGSSDSASKVLWKNPKYLKDKNKKTYAVPRSDEPENIDVKVKRNSPEFTTLGTKENEPNYQEYNFSKMSKGFENSAKSNWELNYFYDTFTYDDPKNIYKQTYQDGSKSSEYGLITFSRASFFSKGGVNTFWAGGVGVGVARGKGVFANEKVESEMFFTLYKVPFDLKFGLEFQMGRGMKLSLAAGPSLMWLFQNRSDKQSDASNKRIRQYSIGHAEEAKLKFALSYFFPSIGKTVFSQYKASKFNLVLSVRHQGYSSFADDISISGVSGGIGFGLETL
jgi:hypothetical protein